MSLVEPDYDTAEQFPTELLQFVSRYDAPPTSVTTSIKSRIYYLPTNPSSDD